MNDILCKQLAADFCCTKADVSDKYNHFMLHEYLAGRRKFQEGEECFLKIAVVNGKVLFSGSKSIIEWCEEQYKDIGSEWFFEVKNLKRINDRLHEDGYQIETVHPFFIAESISEVDVKNYEILWYKTDEIEQFRGDEQYNEAFAFEKDAPDVLGVAAVRDGRILGMAGASCDSPTMWQIGINVAPQSRGAGIGKILAALLKNEILRKGILPFYGTAMSHLASQRVALGAGFVPAWVELAASRISRK